MRTRIKAGIGIAVLLVGIGGCGGTTTTIPRPTGPTITNNTQQSTLVLDEPGIRVARFVDYPAGVVCWYTHQYNALALDCLPLSKTTLEN
jgi:hypothetical protein